MSLQCGLIGLPNIGKSTIFKALTAQQAEIANYPFCTIEPNVGIVSVPDEHLEDLATRFSSQRAINTTIRFVDIAGLIAGAAHGEGLGNAFLAHIRECPLLGHVLRCFTDTDITHVTDTINPIADFETVMTELALADIQTIQRRLENSQRHLMSADKQRAERAKHERMILQQIMNSLEHDAMFSTPSADDEVTNITDELFLLTTKKQIIICNIDEELINKDSAIIDELKDYLNNRFPVIELSGKIEEEICSIENNDERLAFSHEIGLQQSGLQRLIQTSYKELGLITFFTAGPQEAHAWTIRQGCTVAEAAGKIHTSFQEGFIKAEVYNYADLIACGSENNVKKSGKLRIEGAHYIVQNNDILFIHAH